MAEHQHSAVCPVCNGTLTDDTETALISKVQRHAKKNHDMDLTAEQARGLFKEPASK